MKKIILIIALFSLFSCSKDILNINNPNNPNLESLYTEEGITRFSSGIYEKFTYKYWWYVLTYHNIMGDFTFMPWGNFSARWANTTAKITLNDGEILPSPVSKTQIVLLRERNNRSFEDLNAFSHEWQSLYSVNNHANDLLQILNSNKINFDGNAETKLKILKAWAYWWKGFAYSRLGSMYVSGLIIDKPNTTNSNYVTNEDLIKEANINFDKAISLLGSINYNAEVYDPFFESLLPSMTLIGNGGVLIPDMWIRTINTYKARNILVNTYQSDMTSVKWNEIKSLAENGVKKEDKVFTLRSSENNDLVYQTAWSPYRTLNGWAFVSERFVQDYKPGDDRKTQNVKLLKNTLVNARSRGYQFGTRYEFIDVVDGGSYASTSPGAAELYIATSYEENQLMLAEANIHLGNINEGLTYIDNVRNYQNSNLPNISATGLSKLQALEELRSERRVALMKCGLYFYDARRWKVILPTSEEGGRKNAVVIVSGGVAKLATIDYDYLPYWDVPQNELDFNPSKSSVPLTYK